MFTGLVQTVGQITAIEARGDALRIRIDAAGLAPRAIGLGDSIATQGACLTVAALDGPWAYFADVSPETLRCTCGLDRSGPVNLETSLALGDVLGGHMVTGHVDGIGSIEAVLTQGEYRELHVRVPATLAGLVAAKGSLAIDGVSLTVNAVRDDGQGAVATFQIIPHTLQATTLGRRGEGDRVNLEVDLIARYVQRMLGARAGAAGPGAPSR
jgi:riboflavin synthase